MKKFISQAVLLLNLLGALNAAFAQAGSLDPTFGNGGIVQTDFSDPFMSSGAVLTTIGDIVVCGNLNFQTSPAGVLVRYQRNGTLDATFGSNGILVLPLATGLVSGLTIQPDGKLLLLFESSTSKQNFLLRFNSNGQLDTTFASNGRVLLNFPKPQGYSGSFVNLITLQSDGKILLSGAIFPPLRSQLPTLTLLARYLTNGATDVFFGNPRTTPLTNGATDIVFGNRGITEVAAVGAPGAISFSTNGIQPLQAANSNILAGNYMGQIAEFSANGALLNKISPPSQLVVNRGQPATFILTASCCLMGPHSELLAGATVGHFKDNTNAVVNRYNLFGLVTSSAPIRLRPDAPFVTNNPTLLGVDSNDRIVLNVQMSSRSGNAGGLARLNANGSLDTNFGTQGIVITPSGVTFNVLLVQPNNDLIVVGGNTLARYLGQ